MKIFKTIFFEVDNLNIEAFKLFTEFEKRMKYQVITFNQNIIPPASPGDKYKIIRSYLLKINTNRRKNYDDERRDEYSSN